MTSQPDFIQDLLAAAIHDSAGGCPHPVSTGPWCVEYATTILATPSGTALLARIGEAGRLRAVDPLMPDYPCPDDNDPETRWRCVGCDGQVEMPNTWDKPEAFPHGPSCPWLAAPAAEV